MASFTKFLIVHTSGTLMWRFSVTSGSSLSLE